MEDIKLRLNRIQAKAIVRLLEDAWTRSSFETIDKVILSVLEEVNRKMVVFSYKFVGKNDYKLLEVKLKYHLGWCLFMYLRHFPLKEYRNKEEMYAARGVLMELGDYFGRW